MKKIAVMCLIASLVFSSGSMTALASAVNTQEAGQTVTGEETVTQEENETGIQDADIVYPADWDPEDPQNARAYAQIYGDGSDTEEADSEIQLFSMEPLARASVSGMRTSWINYTDDSLKNTKTVTYTHLDSNTENKNVVAGIDVSYHQGKIDWDKVKASGVNFAILRVGYRAYRSGSLAKDSKFTSYIKDAQRVGLKVGVYIYSQAITKAEAEEEADFVLNNIKGYQIDLPVTFDYEFAGDPNGRLDSANLTKAQKTACAEAFCKKVTDAGYQAMVYANASFCEKEMDTAALSQKYQIWMARYNTHTYNSDKDKGKFYGGKLDFWQCSESAKVDGISTKVDLDYWYQPKDGTVAPAPTPNPDPTPTYQAIVEYDTTAKAWVYKVNGKIQTDYSGVAQGKDGWYKIEKGYVDWSFSGLSNNQNGWWYIKGGQVDFNYTGIADNAAGRWCVKGGQVDFDYTGIMNDAVSWWKFTNGKIDTSYTGISNNQNGWWRVKDGQVDFTYNGITNNENGWWKVENGQVNFKYTGVSNNENGWWRVENGKVNFKYNGIAQNSNGWWYIRGGKVDFTYTGWTQVFSGKYYVEKGRVNR